MAALCWLFVAIFAAASKVASALDPSFYPPTNASWTRVANNPVLSASATWEGTCVCENVVIYENGTYKMWYRGGWSKTGIGFATSSDGLAWVKHTGNPVYGGGGSGIHTSPGEPWVSQFGGLYWLYTTDNSGPFMNVSTSPDGLAWTPQAASCPLPPGGTLWGNRVVWQEAGGGSSWKMLQEAMAGGLWQIFLFSSADGLAWAVDNGGAPLSTLQVHPTGMYGGPRFARLGAALTPRFPDGLYHLWYHAGTDGGGLPTDIYHATSADLLAWRISPATPVLAHAGSGWEWDQVAGPVPVVPEPGAPGSALLFYDGDNNVKDTCSIGAATAPAVPA